MVGRNGGLRFTQISGGTGTDTFTPTSFVITGDELDDVFLEVFDTDEATTDTLIDGITA